MIDNASLLGVKVNDTQAEKLINYLALIIKWNKTYNLSAIRTMEQGIKKHLLDSLSIVAFIEDSSLLDVGSGAGLPGIVISIIKPNIPVSVLDSVGKKCYFMQFVKSQLELKNLTVVNERVEMFQPKMRFEQITSRAFSKVENTLKLTQHLLTDDGHYLLMKGANVKKETLPKEAKIYPLFVPEVSDKRFLVKIKSLQCLA